MKECLKKIYYTIFRIKYCGRFKNKLHYKQCTIKKLNINIAGKDNEISVNSGTLLTNTIFEINGSNNKIWIDYNCRVNGLHVKMYASNCILTIGHHCTFETNIEISFAENHRKVIIGEDCMFANDIQIRTSDSHKIFHQNKRINEAKDVVIGNHVWIGNKVTILKGSNISNNSVIGLGSIVTGELHANTLSVGSPAKTILNEIKWER